MNQAAVNPPWATNASLPAIADRIKRSRSLVCFTHSKPDGDAIGSTLALARAAQLCGLQASVVYLAPFPPRFIPLLGDTHVIHESESCWSRPELLEADAIAILDTGSWNQVEGARGYIERRASMAMLIDHHAHGNAEMAAHRHIDTAAASCCEIVAELCRLLLGVDSCRKLPVEVAEPLYLGVATDTGWFRYSNTTPHTLRLAADLIDAGAHHVTLFQMSEQNDQPSRLRLVTRAMANLKLLSDNRVAIIPLSKKDVEETGAQPDDTGGLSDLPNAVASVRVVATLVEVNPSLIKVSFRSKPPRDSEPLVDVNKVAQTFGGGGHVHAAGAKLKMSLADAVAAVTKALT